MYIKGYSNRVRTMLEEQTVYYSKEIHIVEMVLHFMIKRTMGYNLYHIFKLNAKTTFNAKFLPNIIV